MRASYRYALVPLDAEAASSQHTEVSVTSFHCCAGMFSFYSPAGDIDGATLAHSQGPYKHPIVSADSLHESCTLPSW